MNTIETEANPFFELSITKLARKHLLIKLFQEANSPTPRIKCQMTYASTGEVLEDVYNDEANAFAHAIQHAGYDFKTSALREIKSHYHVMGVHHKIGNLEFKKVVRKSLA